MAEDNDIARQRGRQYRDVVQTSIGRSERLKRNVLEIQLEKESSHDEVEEQAVANLLQQVGVRRDDVEGVQFSPPKAPRKVFVWLTPQIDLNQFCFSESYRINNRVKTGIIKPMDRREVEVIVRGLNINTPDGAVMSYLSHFGKLINKKLFI